MRNDFNVKHQA